MPGFGAEIAATPYVFRHLAGALGGPGKADGTGTAARFNYATGVVSDATGNIYVTDSHAGTIRKITANGTVTTIAGMAAVEGSQDGTGSAARFDYPTGPAIDASGNLFVADWANNTIRKITSAGVVTTFAGDAADSSYPGRSVDGVGSVARFWGPSSVAVDASGTLFVADSGYDKIRKITPDGTVTTLAISGAAGWPAGGLWPGKLLGGDPYAQPWGAQLVNAYPSRISIDRAGNLYCGSYQWAPASFGIPSYYLILKIDPSGAVSTVSQFPTVTSLAGPVADKSDRLFVGTPAGLLRLDAAGTLVNATGPIAVTGAGMTITPTGDCIVASGDQILKVTPSGTVGIFAGLAATPGAADGTGTAAGFRSPGGVAVDAKGNVYVSDSRNATIRKISPGGVVTTLAGKAGVTGIADGVGPAAQLNIPTRIIVDAAGNLYVSDNLTIRKITADGAVTTLTGIPKASSLDALAVDEAGNLYFPLQNYDSTTFWSNTINKLTPTGVLTAVATIAEPGIDDLAVDHAGNIYASLKQHVLKIDPRGNITALAGSGANGPGANAKFTKLGGLAIDPGGNILVLDGNAIRRIDADGTTTTIGGSPTSPGSEDGLGGDAQFNAPAAMAVDSVGNIYVADTANHSIRIGELAGPPAITTQPQSQTTPAGGAVQFSVAATGMPAPTYQWYFNGAAFNGATGSTLSFNNARSSDAGDYSVVVTNAVGSVTSSKASLTVSSSPSAAPPASSSGSGGGGGATEAWFFLMLLGLSGAAQLRRSGSQRYEP